MSNVVGTPPFLNLFWVAMETMHFQKIDLDPFEISKDGLRQDKKV